MREAPIARIENDPSAATQRVRERQRGNGIDLLAGQPQQHAAGHQQVQVRSRTQQVAQQRRGLHDLLEVIEHEQQLPRPEVRFDGLREWSTPVLFHAQDPSHRLGHSTVVFLIALKGLRSSCATVAVSCPSTEKRSVLRSSLTSVNVRTEPPSASGTLRISRTTPFGRRCWN